MSLKQEKFLQLLNISNLFNIHKNSIFLFVHVNNVNIIQKNLINFFCNQNNIKSVILKANLLKKISKNVLYLNLLQGPTQLYIFSNFLSYINFLKLLFVKKIIIPLTIYWNNNFFNYNFFYSYILKNYKKNEIFFIDLKQQKSLFIVNIKKPIINFITNINFLKLFYILNHLLKNKKN